MKPERLEPFLAPFDRKGGLPVPEFPTDPERRMHVLANAFNNGARALTYILLATHSSVTTYDFYDGHFSQVFKGTEIEGFTRSSVLNYLHVFHENGLISSYIEEERKRQNRILELNPTTANFGVLAAVNTLLFEEAIDETAFVYLGETSVQANPDPSQPYVRTRVLEHARMHGSWKGATETAESLGFPVQSVTAAMDELKRLGLLEKRTKDTKRRSNLTEYELNPQYVLQPQEAGKRPSELEKEIRQACEQLTSAGEPISDDHVIGLLSQERRSKWKTVNLKIAVNVHLKDLQTKGYLSSQPFGYRITDSGTTIADTFVKRLRGIASEDPEVWAELFHKVEKLRNGQVINVVAAKTARRYYPHSRAARDERVANLQAKIAELLIHTPDPISIRELCELTGTKRQFVVDTLKWLESSGTSNGQVYQIEETKERGIYGFRLVPTE